MEENYQSITPEPRRVSSGGEDKVFAALSYISILFVVPLILKHENDDIYFHAKQGMVLFLSEVVIWFVLFMLESFIVALLPRTTFSLTAWLGAVAWMLFVVLSVAGVYNALVGKRWEIPILGRIAKSVEV